MIDSKEMLIGHKIKVFIGYSSYDRREGILYRMNGGLWIQDRKGNEVWIQNATVIEHLRNSCVACKTS